MRSPTPSVIALVKAVRQIVDDSVFSHQRFEEDTDTDYFLRWIGELKGRLRAHLSAVEADLEQQGQDQGSSSSESGGSAFSATSEQSPAELALCTTECFECGGPLEGPFCLACNPEMRPMWRPISSAPRDGTRVLGWLVHSGDDICPDPFSRPSIMYWDDGNVTPGFEREAGWEAQWIGKPTHWMPLPDPPSTEAPSCKATEPEDAHQSFDEGSEP